MLGGLLLHLELGTFYVFGSISNFYKPIFRSIHLRMDERERHFCNIELYGYHLSYPWFNHNVLLIFRNQDC